MILTIVLTILAGILYRMGGSDTYPKIVRRLGVPVCVVLWAGLNGFHDPLTLFFTLGLVFASQLSYYDWMNEYLGQPEEDKKWFNWLAVGVGFGLSTILLTTTNGLWFGFGYRILATAIFTMVWSELISNAVWEENGRGAIQIATLPLLLIGA